MQSNLMDMPDELLVTQSLQGDRHSIELLITRYSSVIYNLCYRMVADKAYVADLSQEIFIRMITKLSTFKHDSAFKTWLYRIAVNHILNYRENVVAGRTGGFKAFAHDLDEAPDWDLNAGEYYGADQHLLVEETKQTCMSGMLLCLDVKHRLVFILGELFGINDRIGSEVLGISPENFRTILSRGKRDLYQFMHDKCGLVNKSNPCRCEKKTRAFIKAGFVHPSNLRFTGHHLRKIKELAEEKQGQMEDLLENEYRQLYLQHSLVDDSGLVDALKQLLQSEKINTIFKIN